MFNAYNNSIPKLSKIYVLTYNDGCDFLADLWKFVDIICCFLYVQADMFECFFRVDIFRQILQALFYLTVHNCLTLLT